MRTATATAPINHHQAAARATRARRAHSDREAATAGRKAHMARLSLQGPIATVARMAEFIVTRVAGVDGNCTEQDLLQAGFTEADMQLLPDAKRLAAKQAPGLQGGA
jgi:hypothetical protein